MFGILLLDAQNAGFLFNYFLGFCSTLILLIGTNFLKDFHSNLFLMVYDLFCCVLSRTS